MLIHEWLFQVDYLRDIYPCLSKTFIDIKGLSIISMQSFYHIHTWQLSHFYQMECLWVANLSTMKMSGK